MQKIKSNKNKIACFSEQIISNYEKLVIIVFIKFLKIH